MNQWVPPTPLIDRVLPRLVADGGCWLWTGFVDKAGYGRVRLGGRTKPVGYVHRVTFEFFLVDVPSGLHIDHLCRARSCANPWHLDPVPPGVNLLRGMAPSVVAYRAGTCMKGHPKTPEHWNGLQCRTCKNARRRARRAS